MVQAGLGAEGRFATRAIWVDPPSFASAEAADRMVRRCREGGFNLILPNVMAHQGIAFKSRHFAGRVRADETFDPLAHVIQKAHAAGIKVQPWCCVYYEGSGGRSNEALHPDWLSQSMDGKPFGQNFLSPANPAVNPYLLSVMSDLLAYDIDGIHLDYIRYPGTGFDYSQAGRAACKSALGFDPRDFVDHPERIVPEQEDVFPVRVLHPGIHAEKVWEVTAIERTLDQAGIGFAFVSESAEQIARLRAPGLLILSSYYDASPEIVASLLDYASRGGNVLWSDVPSKLLVDSAQMRQLTGLTKTRWKGESVLAITASGDHPLAKNLPHERFRVESVSIPTVGEARVVAKLDTGDPAITVHQVGKGRVIVPGFHMMKSTSPVVANVAKAVVNWLRSEAGVSAPDRLGARRAEWVAWRAAGVAQLVRAVSQKVKQKSPNLVVSSSAGPSPWEFYSCYRDARGWLREGINDEVFPMNYTTDPVILGEILELQTASAPSGTKGRIFPGLQIYTKKVSDGKPVTGPMDAAVVEKQLNIVRQQGYNGFCLFAYNSLTDEILAVVRKFSALPGRE